MAEQGYMPTFTLVDYYDVGDGSVFRELSRTRPYRHSQLTRSG